MTKTRQPHDSVPDNSNLVAQNDVAIMIDDADLNDELMSTEEAVDKLIARYGGARFSAFIFLMLVIGLSSRVWWFY